MTVIIKCLPACVMACRFCVASVYDYTMKLRCFARAGFVLALLLHGGNALAVDCGTIVLPPGVGEGPGSDVTSFNPLLVQTIYNEETSYLLFSQLIWINRYHQIDYSRSVASAVASPDNGKTYNVTLRDWHWSDGVQVTSADVEYTYDLLKQLGNLSPDYGQGGMPDIIQNFHIVDATHFTITLRHSVNPDWFILNGLELLEPLPKHIWGRYTQDQIWQDQSTPAFFAVGDGPLSLQSFVVGQDAVFVPNKNYDGPQVHFQRFILKFMDSEGMELQAAESHDLDITNLPFALWNAAQHLPGLHLVDLPPSYSWHELIPNMANHATPFFTDLRVREAMADAINQPQMIALAMHGHGEPVYNGIPPGPANFSSASAQAGQYAVGYDPAKAKALLAQAGYTAGAGGIMQKNGQRLVFTLMIPADQAMRIEMAESIQQDLRAVGIDMKVQQVEFNQMMALNAGVPQGWEAMMFASQVNAFPSGEAEFKTGGFYNSNGYSDPTMDRLIDASTNKPGLDGLYAYQDYASAQQPVIFLPDEAYSVLVRNGLQGVQNFLNPLGMWDPAALYCTAPGT
jgi:peptide/nickel transport system substrate-binding protein